MGVQKAKPKLSIITVCYNSEKTIVRAMQSVLNQSYDDYEYIIIDGGSEDGTLEEIEKLRSAFGEKVRVVSEPDNGIYDAMNKGISMASGELIGMVNSDDYYEADAFKNVVATYNPNIKYQVVYGFQRNITDGREEGVVLYNHEFLDMQMITHPTCFVSRSIYDDYGMFDIGYRSSADYEFMLRIFHKGGVTFTPVYKIISNFSSGGMSSSEFCVRETAKLHLDYGVISKGEYAKIILRSYLHNLIKRLTIKCQD